MCLLKGAKSLSEERETIALWRDEMSDEKHEEIRRLSSTLIEKGFSAVSLRFELCEGTC